jgi:hypothetical protein
LFRRKKKDTSAPDDVASTGDAGPDPAVAEGTGTTDAPDDTDSIEVAVPAPADRVDVADDGDFDDLIVAPAEVKQHHPRYQPQAVPLATPYGGEEHLRPSYWVGGVKEVLTKSGTSTAEEREREAAAEFQAAIMPGLMGLRDAVPDAATPEEAMRTLAAREAEHSYPEDPEAGSLSQRDIFRTDASVYYRIRNRFEKPRRRVGWGDPWRPPPGLARPDPPHRALNRGK